MTNHGGARRNAGRPKMKPQDKRTHANFTLSTKLVEQLNRAVASGKRGRFVEAAIKFRLGEHDASTK
jgi:hypothetical protein